jgi:hypothetical protein
MSIIGRLKEKIAQYVDVYIRLIKINFIGRTANLLSYLMFAMISLFIAFCIILFLGFGLVEVFVALGLSKLASFFITIGIYLLLLAVVIASRKKITRFFASGIISVLTDDDEDEGKE